MGDQVVGRELVDVVEDERGPLAEEALDPPPVSAECAEALATGLLSDLSEGHAPYRPRYLLPDYYFVCLNEETGGPGSRANILRPVTPDSDRDSGFVYLPDSLTFKPIDMSFRRRTRTAGARLEVS